MFYDHVLVLHRQKSLYKTNDDLQRSLGAHIKKD